MRVTRTQEGAFMRLTLTTQPEPGTQYSLQTELGVYMYHAPESFVVTKHARHSDLLLYRVTCRIPTTVTTGTGRTKTCASRNEVSKKAQHSRGDALFSKKRTGGAAEGVVHGGCCRLIMFVLAYVVLTFIAACLGTPNAPSDAETKALSPQPLPSKKFAAQVLVRRLPTTKGAKPGPWMTFEEYRRDPVEKLGWIIADVEIGAAIEEDFSRRGGFDGSKDGILSEDAKIAAAVAEEGLDAWRGPPLIERLLTVLEVQLPNVTARLPAMAVADALNEIVRFAHKRVYLLIHNFPADNAMVQGWDAVKRLCRNCLHSTNLVVSDGRNPRCWAGQTALTREQRADWALRCKRYDESQVTCADYPGSAIGKCTTLGQYAALVERSVPPGGANTFRNHSSESDEDNDAEHDDDDDDTERVDSKDDSDDDHDDNETPGAKFAKLRQKLARPDPYASIQETASVVHKRSVVPGVEQTFSLFDYSIRQHCEPYFRQHDVQLYDRAFTVPGFAPGHPAFPNLYLHPAGSMSGIHRDADHSYFYLRLLRGRKVARAWAMDTRIGSLQFGESWDAMPGRYAQFVMEPGDIFFGPSDGFHAVRTLQASLASSTNYFPAHMPPPMPPASPPPTNSDTIFENFLRRKSRQKTVESSRQSDQDFHAFDEAQCTRVRQ